MSSLTDAGLSNDARATLETAQMLAGDDADAELWIPHDAAVQELIDAGLIITPDRRTYFLTDQGRGA